MSEDKTSHTNLAPTSPHDENGRQSSEYCSSFVVGIGASAGGVKALTTFFENVPADSGIVYVVILHMSPDFDSHLAEILQMTAKVRVTQVRESATVEPNHVYVVPPNKHLTMLDGNIAVSPNTLIEDRRAPVDIFFRTLADSCGRRAIGVVLSGTGANGSMGVKRIKEFGGAIFVQRPDEAEFGEMPRNSLATGLVDAALPVAEIPGRIVSYAAQEAKVRIPLNPEALLEDQQQALREIFRQLRNRTGNDFSNYKRPTLLRRIGRRMTVNDIGDLPSYADFLIRNEGEAHALLKDLLISVTNFFRDKKAFISLEDEVLPGIFKGKTSEDEVRIWVAACATGEEAYSVAMLCAEQSFDSTNAPKVKIFATDIDEAALAVAREGFYTINDAADISPERLRRFFSKEGDAYRVKPEIREMVLFAVHNIVKGPPFSHLDLATCRNLLIYLNDRAKERVLETLHFALEPGGFLLIGTSETLDGFGDIFAMVSRESRIYQTLRAGPRALPVPDVSTLPAASQRGFFPRKNHFSQVDRISYGELHRHILEKYAPPSVVVNADYDIVHLSESAGQYLHVGGGEPTRNLLKTVLPELRLELRSALYQAVKQRTDVEVPNVAVTIAERAEVVNLVVRPVLETDDSTNGYILVLFDKSAGTESVRPPAMHADGPLSDHLEEQLIRTRLQLRSASDEYEIQTHELTASNEELQALNEELRASTEELETSREELQSINEELRTVNQELKVKVDEATTATNNLQNLINSTNIPTIFLDRSLRIQLFTPAARDIFNLASGDLARPLSDITHRLMDVDLLADTTAVLERFHQIEREVRSTDGRDFLLCVSPYRTGTDSVLGVVLTFVNITARKSAETRLKSSEAQLRLLVESAADFAIFTMDTDRKITVWNAGAEAMFGYTADEIIGKTADILFTLDDQRAGEPENEVNEASRRGRCLSERWLQRRDGSKFFGSGAVNPLGQDDGCILGYVKIIRDLTTQINAQEDLRRSEQQLRNLIESARDYAIIGMDPDGKIVSWNIGAKNMFAYEPDEAIGKSCDIIFTPEDRAAGAPETEREFAARIGKAADQRWHTDKHGRRFFVSGEMWEIRGSSGELEGFVKIAKDVTELISRQDELEKMRETLESMVVERTRQLAASNQSLLDEINDRKRIENERVALLRKIVTTQEDERQRIARDLHDEMGQRLTALRLKIASIEERLASGQQVESDIVELAELAAKLDSEVGFLAWELRPAALDDLGLAAAVPNYVREWSAHSNVKTEFHLSGLKRKRLDIIVETNLYRIVQEALNNVKKHAKATHVNVLLEVRGGQVVVIVEDNGRGFEPGSKVERSPSGGGLGLIGMRERAAIVGGTLEIESAPGSGTTVFAKVPALFSRTRR